MSTVGRCTSNFFRIKKQKHNRNSIANMELNRKPWKELSAWTAWVTSSNWSILHFRVRWKNSRTIYSDGSDLRNYTKLSPKHNIPALPRDFWKLLSDKLPWRRFLWPCQRTRYCPFTRSCEIGDISCNNSAFGRSLLLYDGFGVFDDVIRSIPTQNFFRSYGEAHEGCVSALALWVISEILIATLWIKTSIKAKWAP